MKTYQYNPLRDREIRLLRLDSGDSSEGIRCSIIHVQLDDLPPYEALSYTWGDPVVKRPISCNEFNEGLQVTSNCELALRRLRYYEKERVLWIDAICIDQSNLLERSHQVQLMATIYQQAQKVLVYLGEESPSSATAVDFITADHASFGTSASRPSMGLGNGVTSSPQQRALDDLLSRPWFSRVWILQEINFASDIEVLCGPATVSWRALVSVADYLDMNKGLHYMKGEATPLPSVIHIRDRHKKGYLSGRKESSESLLQKLHGTRHCKATDPRDKIYSLLAMTTEGHEKDFEPDYFKPATEIFTNLVRFLITRDASLDILSGVQPTSSLPSLPSWVPDWSTSPLSSPLGYPHPPNGIYRTSNALPAITSFPDARTLCARGRLFDTILTLGDIYTAKIPTTSKRILQQWRTLASEKALIPYPTGLQDAETAYMETITASNLKTPYEQPNKLVDMFGSSWRTHFYSFDENPNPNENENLRAAPSDPASKTLAEAQILQDFVAKACIGRRFFVTEKGYIGLGPPGAQKGDVITVLLGGQVPFVLRKQQEGNFYVLVSECYVYRIMKGEAVQDAESESEIKDLKIR